MMNNADDLYEDLKSVVEGTEEKAPEGAASDELGKDIANDLADVLRDEEGKKEPEKPADEPKKEEVKAEEAPDVPAKEEQPKPEEGVKLDENRAPSSWSAKVREKWKDLPQEVRQEVLRREEAHANGVRKLQEEFQPVKQFTEALGGVIQEAANVGLPPVQFIHNMARAEYSLRNGSPEQRMEALFALADQYGLPLRQFVNVPQAQQPSQQAQTIPPQIQQELEASRQFRQQFEQQTRAQQEQTVQRQVQEFAAKNEFFEDVRDIMADLMDANPNRTLEQAYEQAIWAHPEVRQVMLQRQQQQAAQEQGKQRRAAAAGASLSSSDPGVAVADGMGDTIEEVIRNAFKASSGRV